MNLDFSSFPERALPLLLATLVLSAASARADDWVPTAAPPQHWISLVSSANGTNLAAAAYEGGIYVSTDAGTTWRTNSSSIQPWAALASSSDGQFLIAAANPGGLWRSTNSGSTWTLLPLMTTNAWLTAASSSQGTVLAAAAGVDGIFVSSDAGASWYNTNWPGAPIVAIASSVDGAHLVAAAQPGPILVSTDSGQSWTPGNAPALSWTALACSADGSQCVAAAADNGIYRSRDGGLNWAQTTAPTGAWSAILSSTDGSHLTAAIRYGGIFGSLDSGDTWTQIGIRTNAWSSLAGAFDGTHLAAASFGGQICRLGEVAFAFQNGLFQGLFYDTNAVAPQSTGFFSALTRSNGIFSAKLQIAGRTFPFSGRFDTNGITTNLVRYGKETPLHVSMQLDPGGNALSGSVSHGPWLASLLADRFVFSKTNPPTQAGNKYTVAIADGLDIGQFHSDPTHPSAIGTGTVSVDGSGKVSFLGRLRNGTPIAQKTFVSGVGQFPVYAAPDAGKSLVLGWLTFTNSDLGDLDGSVTWIKPSDDGGKPSSAGFTNLSGVIGSLFQTNFPPLNFSTGQLVVVVANLTPPATNWIVLNPDHTVTGTNHLTIVFNPSSGSFKGSIPDPFDPRTIRIAGVALQRQGLGLGFFTRSNQIGAVLLSP